MASVNQTRPQCVTQMGKTHSKPLAARHGRGTKLARHGNDMLCVNRPLRIQGTGFLMMNPNVYNSAIYHVSKFDSKYLFVLK